jgi:hypothetical protein
MPADVSGLDQDGDSPRVAPFDFKKSLDITVIQSEKQANQRF